MIQPAAVPIETGEGWSPTQRYVHVAAIAERLTHCLTTHEGLHNPGACHHCDDTRDLVFMLAEWRRISEELDGTLLKLGEATAAMNAASERLEKITQQGGTA